MIIGGVYYFTSDRVIGRAERDKYHIYLGEANHWLADEDQTFMLINKGDYGGCCPVSKAICGALDYDSYVGCNGLVFYPTSYLPAIERTYQEVTLPTDFLKTVRSHIAASALMEEWQISIACRVLDSL